MFEGAKILQGQSKQKFVMGTEILLEPGFYDVWADAATYLKVDTTKADNVTSDTGYLLRESQTVTLEIVNNSYLGASGDTNFVYCHKVG